MTHGITRATRRTRRPGRPRHRHARAGVSTVELAVCLPVLLLLVIGSIECSSIIFVKQGMTAAAYEGIRVAADPDGTEMAAEHRCNEVLNARDIQNATITITPKNIEQLSPGQPIEVKITAPSAGNRFIPAEFVKDLQISVVAVMAKE